MFQSPREEWEIPANTSEGTEAMQDSQRLPELCELSLVEIEPALPLKPIVNGSPD